MPTFEAALQLVYDAIGDVNATLAPSQAVELAPNTILIGESGQLDSVGFLNIAVAIEEHVERTFKESISLFDVVATDDRSEWTVEALATRIVETLQ